MATHGGRWLHMEAFGYTWRQMATHGGIWLHMEADSYTSGYMATHGGRGSKSRQMATHAVLEHFRMSAGCSGSYVDFQGPTPSHLP